MTGRRNVPSSAPTISLEAGTGESENEICSYSPSMYRFLRIATKCFVFGVIANIVVAWILAIISQTGELRNREFLRQLGYGSRYRDPSALELWQSAQLGMNVGNASLHVVRSWPCAEIQFISGPAINPTDAMERWDVIQSVETGWPFRSFRGQRLIRDDALRNSMTQPIKVFRVRVLPFMPLWSGLWWDMVLFGGVPFVLVEVPLILRDVQRWNFARRERRRGCCPECGYDLRGQPSVGCPECGWGRTDQS